MVRAAAGHAKCWLWFESKRRFLVWFPYQKVYGKMLPRNTCKKFLSHSRQIFLIPRQRPFPEPVKAAAAKLSSLFLCKLLNRFRFSPQIVIFLPETPQNTRHPPPSHFSGGCLIQQIICIYLCIYRVMPSGLPSSLRGGRVPAWRLQR